jgi:pimeloyl-ACP methyl ester carboxylesterase
MMTREGEAVMDIAEDELEANGWTFSVRSVGPEDGRPVILLHGFPETSRAFSNQLLALGDAGFRAVAPDQRGYSAGARPVGVEHYQVADLMADVDAMADALGMDTFDLVGHDWGGIVAWRYAAARPHRVRTLTSVSTPHPSALADALSGGDPDQVERSSYLSLFREPDVPEQLLLGEDGAGEGFRQMMSTTGLGEELGNYYVDVLSEPGALTAALNWYRATDLAVPIDIGPVVSPTMYVWSTDDIALGRTAAEATAGWVEGPYRFEVLEGVSHWIPEAAPDQLNRLLLDHLG